MNRCTPTQLARQVAPRSYERMANEDCGVGSQNYDQLENAAKAADLLHRVP
eukprot:SAG31_NODE_6849_length_1870_cov_1.849802_1_plen_51_part_00